MNTQGKPPYTKEEYLNSWKYQIDQFRRVAPGDCDDAIRVRRISEELFAIVKREADTLFRGEV